MAKYIILFVLVFLPALTFANLVDDFSSGLDAWTLQRRPGDFVENPGGQPVVSILSNGQTDTVATFNTAGVVNDFDIAVSFAGASNMTGNDSYGLVFGLQDANNYYIAHLFPGFPGSAFRVQKMVNGSLQAVFPGSTSDHNVGFTFARGDGSIAPDALRVTRTGNNFEAFVADSSAGDWQSFSGSSWIDSTFAAGSVGIGERFNSTSNPTGTRFAMFGTGDLGIDEVLLSTDNLLGDSTSNFSSPVPEPSTTLLLLMGLLLGLTPLRK